jgi:hypothetical protein
MRPAAVIISSLVAVSFGCGGGGGNTTAGALPDQACTVFCQKLVACAPGTESFATCVANSCTPTAADGSHTCTNQSQIMAAFISCEAMTDCTALITCLSGLPACDSGVTGTGGAAGAGGAAGSGGAQGADAGDQTSCDACAKAGDCCLAYGMPAAACMSFSTTSCDALTGNARAGLIDECVALRQGGLTGTPPPAACN